MVGSNIKINIFTHRTFFKSPKKSMKNNVQKMYVTINSIKNEEFNSQARRSKGLKRKLVLRLRVLDLNIIMRPY